jgi:hypothetical protein
MSTIGAILGAALAGQLLGWIWYNENVLGKVWFKLSGVSKKHMDQMQKKMIQSVLLNFIALIILSASISLFLDTTSLSGVAGGIGVALFGWIGFILTTSLPQVVWEGKPWSFWILNNVYWLLMLVLIGGIVGGFS